MKRIATIVGARPQFIKAAPLSQAIAGAAGLEERLIHTGQHYDYEMSQIFFEQLSLPEPAEHLGVGSAPHGAQTGAMLEKIEASLVRDRPDLVLVYGDTNSTLAGALAAVKLHIPVAHVEAGLRSYNPRMAEEINRVLTDHMSTLLFTPSPVAVGNLAREGITRGVHTVGDVMCDIAHSAAKLERPSALKTLGITRGDFVLVTIHRAENTDDPARLRAIFDALAAAGTLMVVPLHPRTRSRLAQELPDRVRLIKPVSFLDMAELESAARVIVTDSGGVQKEAMFHHVPCVTVRPETEWTETVELGWNRLVEPSGLRDAVLNAKPGPAFGVYPYGDGRAAEKIARILASAWSSS